jgi:hypothetical protein
VIGVRSDDRSRLERLLDPAYLENLDQLTLDDLQARHAEAAQEGIELKYLHHLLRSLVDAEQGWPPPRHPELSIERAAELVQRALAMDPSEDEVAALAAARTRVVRVRVRLSTEIDRRRTRRTNSTERVPVSAVELLPVSIYLSEEAGHERVQERVEEFLRVTGAAVVVRGEPEIGSWFRRLTAYFTGPWASPEAREALVVAAHAAEAKLVLKQDAAVTAELMQHLGPVLESLEHTRKAVIRAGALLIVKVDDTTAVHQLTSAQQLRLDHHPQLAMSPEAILTALEIAVPEKALTPPEHPALPRAEHG